MVPTGTSWGEQNSNQHHPTLPHSASRILGQLDPTDTIMGGGQYLSARPAPLCLVAVAGVEIEALCSLPWQGGRFLAGVWLEWGKYFQRGVCSAKLPCSLWLQGFSLGLFFFAHACWWFGLHPVQDVWKAERKPRDPLPYSACSPKIPQQFTPSFPSLLLCPG